jgi:hypothetical protein
MAGQFTMTASVDKLTLRRIQAKLGGTTLYGDALARALKDTVEAGEGRVRSRAPLGETHALWGSVSHAIDPRPVPLWAKVIADATRSGFRYGWALQASKKIVYRHRQGARAGRPTRRWFTGAKPWMKKRLEENLVKMARRVEMRWGR